MRHLQLTAVVHKDDDMYVADCPEVGTVSQGYTFEEAVENLKEATEIFLEEFPERLTCDSSQDSLDNR